MVFLNINCCLGEFGLWGRLDWLFSYSQCSVLQIRVRGCMDVSVAFGSWSFNLAMCLASAREPFRHRVGKVFCGPVGGLLVVVLPILFLDGILLCCVGQLLLFMWGAGPGLFIKEAGVLDKLFDAFRFVNLLEL